MLLQLAFNMKVPITTQNINDIVNAIRDNSAKKKNRYPKGIANGQTQEEIRQRMGFGTAQPQNSNQQLYQNYAGLQNDQMGYGQWGFPVDSRQSYQFSQNSNHFGQNSD